MMDLEKRKELLAKYDPINDEHTPYTPQEFVEICEAMLEEWLADGLGEKPLQEKHDFNYWLGWFSSFISW